MKCEAHEELSQRVTRTEALSERVLTELGELRKDVRSLVKKIDRTRDLAVSTRASGGALAKAAGVAAAVGAAVGALVTAAMALLH